MKACIKFHRCQKETITKYTYALRNISLPSNIKKTCKDLEVFVHTLYDTATVSNLGHLFCIRLYF